MATTTTQSASSTLQPTISMRSRVGTSLIGFLAILRRDIVVTEREFISFLLQVLLQPLFFLFIFGKVLSSIGFTGRGFTAILLPGIIALTVVTTALQGVTLPLVLDLGFAREIDDRLLAPLPAELVPSTRALLLPYAG